MQKRLCFSRYGQTPKAQSTLSKNVKWLICAFIIVLTLDANLYIIDGEQETRIGWYMSRIAASFTTDVFKDTLVLIVALYVIQYVSQRRSRVDIPAACMAVLLSALFLVSMSYANFNSFRFFTYNTYQKIFSGFCLFGFSIFFYYTLCFLSLYFLERSYIRTQNERKLVAPEKFMLQSTIVIFLCWLPWILMNYPGTPCYDSNYQLSQFFGEAQFTSHHPPLSTFIMGSLTVLGDLLWNNNFGVFLYILFHSILGALIFSLALSRLYKLGLSLPLCWAGSLFYALLPVWGAFAQWIEKDLLYAEVITLFTIFLGDIIIDESCNRKRVVFLILSGLLASLLRNNGIYAVIASVSLAAVMFYGKTRKSLLLSALATAVLYIGITIPLYQSVLGIEKGSIREALSIPFQQTARYVTNYGDEVTEEEREAIDAVLDYDKLENQYRPFISDSIKSTYKEDNSKLPAYFKVWFTMFLKHPGIYIESFINGAYGYAAPIVNDIEADIGIEFTQFKFMESLGLHRVFNSMPTEIFKYIKDISRDIPLVRYLLAPGTYTWLALFCAFLTIRAKQFKNLILHMPVFMNIIVCMASPLACSIRYALPAVASAPLIIGWTLYYISKSNLSKV